MCKMRNDVCRIDVNNTKICAVRKNNTVFEFKDFDNSCYLFLSNMCENPGVEFHIVASATCDPDITRRQFEEPGVQNETEIPVTDASVTDTPMTDISTTDIPAADVTATEIASDTSTTDNPEAETTAINDPAADDSATDDPEPETTATNDPAADDSTTDDPEADTTVTNVPATDDSTTDDPEVDTTATNVPATDDSTIDDPEAGTTATNVPATDDSTTDDPEADTTVTSVPTVDDTATDVPDAKTTATNDPTIVVVATDVSVTDDPTAEVNATESPAVEDYTTAIKDGNTTKPGLRAMNVSEYDTAWCPDRHRCAPLTCPNVYRPVCMNINHKFSQNPKIYTFVNHCVMDRYYCTHYKEFEVPEKLPGPRAVVSFLDWSYCSAQRYLKFLFTARAASSMGHYGWLHGDDHYAKILEPWERHAGYG